MQKNRKLRYRFNIPDCSILSVVFICLFIGNSFSENSLLRLEKECVAETFYSYSSGEGIDSDEVNIDKALDICGSAASLGTKNLETLFGLARAHGLAGNYQEEIEMLSKLTKLQHAKSAVELAMKYTYGENLEIDYEKSLDLLRMAYNAGDIAAAFRLFDFYYWGMGIEENEELARRYLGEAAEAGHSYAKVYMAEYLAYGSYGYEIDVPRAKKLLIEELRLGNTFADLIYNILISDFPADRFELERAIIEIKAYAESGDTDALTQMIYMHLNDDWKNEVGNQFDVILSPEGSFPYLLGLLQDENGYGLGPFYDFLTPKFSTYFTNEQTNIFLERLESISSNPNKIDVVSSIKAAETLYYIYKQGIFQPINNELALNQLKKAALNYKDPYFQIELGLFYFDTPGYIDVGKAFNYTRMAISSGDKYYEAHGYNNLGVFHHHSDSNDRFQKAKTYYLKSVDALENTQFTMDTPYSNLARNYLYNQDDYNLSLAREFSKLAVENNGSGFIQELMDRYPFKNEINVSNMFYWLENEVLNGSTEGLMEAAILADYNEVSSRLKYLNLCAALCEEWLRKIAKLEIFREKKEVTGTEFFDAQAEAQEWLLDNLATVRSAQANKEALEEKQDTPELDYVFDGVFHVLLIGATQYYDYDTLVTPLNDIRVLGELLEEQYNARVTYLENPERRDITKAFNNLKKRVSSVDNVLIFYAGHGWIDEDTDEGYWLPVDAEFDDDSNYISNSYLRNKIKALDAKNVLLMADSCFSGSLVTRGVKLPNFKTSENYVQKYLDTKSRVTITSGGVKPVLDSAGGSHSIFAEALIESLSSTERPLTSAELYLDLRDKVTIASTSLGIDQTPLRGEMINEGHEGPDFIFLPN